MDLLYVYGLGILQQLRYLIHYLHCKGSFHYWLCCWQWSRCHKLITMYSNVGGICSVGCCIIHVYFDDQCKYRLIGKRVSMWITQGPIDCICLHVIPDQVAIPLSFIHSQSWNTVNNSRWSTTLQYQKPNRWRWISSHRVKIKQQHHLSLSYCWSSNVGKDFRLLTVGNSSRSALLSFLLSIISRPCTGRYFTTSSH